MKNLIEERDLITPLTEAEVQKYAMDLAKNTTTLAEEEDKKKSAMSGFKDRIDRLISESRILARKISEQQELRTVKCEWIPNFPIKKAFLHRMDTGEVIDERPLTEKELQMNLMPEDLIGKENAH
jgi:hypothetical protein